MRPADVRGHERPPSWRGAANDDRYYRTFAAVLRLDGVVYVNPDWIAPEDLTDFGCTPERIVVGIPARTVEAAAQ